MDVHFCFPITADITLCGELTDDEPLIMNVFKVTCKKCRGLIDEISRQVVGAYPVPEKEPLGSKD